MKSEKRKGVSIQFEINSRKYEDHHIEYFILDKPHFTIIDAHNDVNTLSSVDDIDLISQHSSDNLHLIEESHALTILEAINIKVIF
jgi:hypothetical protein